MTQISTTPLCKTITIATSEIIHDESAKIETTVSIVLMPPMVRQPQVEIGKDNSMCASKVKDFTTREYRIVTVVVILSRHRRIARMNVAF